jgi:hypothetical protein
MTNDQRKIIELTIAADLEQAAMIRARADRDVQLGGWRGAYDLLHDESMSAVRFNLKQLEETLRD